MLERAYFPFLATNPGYVYVIYLLLLAGACGVFICLARGIRAWKNREAFREPIICLAVPVIAAGGLFLSRTPLYPHYFTSIYPYPFLFAGIAFGALHGVILKLPAGVNRPLRLGLALLLCAVVYWQAAHTVLFFRVLEKWGGTTGNYGLTFAAQLNRASKGRYSTESSGDPRLKRIEMLRNVVWNIYGQPDTPNRAAEAGLFEKMH